ncbi:unnamed protein product, partial [Iphiclides podalirius]
MTSKLAARESIRPSSRKLCRAGDFLTGSASIGGCPHYLSYGHWLVLVTSLAAQPIGGADGRRSRRAAVVLAAPSYELCVAHGPPHPAPRARLARILVVGVTPCSPRVCHGAQCAVCECLSSRPCVSATERYTSGAEPVRSLAIESADGRD